LTVLGRPSYINENGAVDLELLHSPTAKMSRTDWDSLNVSAPIVSFAMRSGVDVGHTRPVRGCKMGANPRAYWVKNEVEGG
jgi:hypothetical protein